MASLASARRGLQEVSFRIKSSSSSSSPSFSGLFPSHPSLSLSLINNLVPQQSPQLPTSSVCLCDVDFAAVVHRPYPLTCHPIPTYFGTQTTASVISSADSTFSWSESPWASRTFLFSFNSNLFHAGGPFAPCFAAAVRHRRQEKGCAFSCECDVAAAVPLREKLDWVLPVFTTTSHIYAVRTCLRLSGVVGFVWNPPVCTTAAATRPHAAEGTYPTSMRLSHSEAVLLAAAAACVGDFLQRGDSFAQQNSVVVGLSRRCTK